MARPSSDRRALTAERLVLASHNEGKLRELRALLAPFGVAVVSASEFGLPEPDETGASFLANAELKALAAARAARLPALADDSGLEVAAFDGAPGIHSARWAGPNKDFASVFVRLKQGVTARADDRARFVCALVLAWPDGHCERFEGVAKGRLVFPPRGENGFGYDPIFAPEGGAQTFAEMDSAAKRRISHRTRAFEQLVAFCFPARRPDAG